jgi:hypothetical protein
MTRPEAEQFLKDNARKMHTINWAYVGPSHGDPGGYSVIVSACKAVEHDSFAVKSIKDDACSCGAVEHNKRVQLAIYKLKGLA